MSFSCFGVFRRSTPREAATGPERLLECTNAPTLSSQKHLDNYPSAPPVRHGHSLSSPSIFRVYQERASAEIRGEFSERISTRILEGISSHLKDREPPMMRSISQASSASSILRGDVYPKAQPNVFSSHPLEGSEDFVRSLLGA